MKRKKASRYGRSATEGATRFRFVMKSWSGHREHTYNIVGTVMGFGGMVHGSDALKRIRHAVRMAKEGKNERIDLSPAMGITWYAQVYPDMGGMQAVDLRDVVRVGVV